MTEITRAQNDDRLDKRCCRSTTVLPMRSSLYRDRFFFSSVVFELFVRSRCVQQGAVFWQTTRAVASVRHGARARGPVSAGMRLAGETSRSDALPCACVRPQKQIASVLMNASLPFCHFLLYGIRLLICSLLYRQLCSSPLWQSPYSVRNVFSFLS